MRCKSCNRANLPNEKICRYCGTELPANVDRFSEPRLDSGIDKTPASEEEQGSKYSSDPSSTIGNKRNVDNKLFGKPFKWLLAGWGVFWVLGWSTANYGAAIELIVALSIAFVGAVVSTVIVRGIREFLKPSAESGHKVEAAEIEIAKLRRKVKELSEKNGD